MEYIVKTTSIYVSGPITREEKFNDRNKAVEAYNTTREECFNEYCTYPNFEILENTNERVVMKYSQRELPLFDVTSEITVEFIEREL